MHSQRSSNFKFLTLWYRYNISFEPFKKTIFVSFKQNGFLLKKAYMKLEYEEHSEFLHHCPY